MSRVRSGHANESDEQPDAVQAADRITDALNDLGSKRWMPRPPRLVRRLLPNLPPQAQQRLDTLIGVLRPLTMIVGGTLTLALTLKLIGSVTLTEPGNAREVFERAHVPQDVAYSVEVIRLKRIDGALLRRDSLRGFQVDPEERKLRAQVSGITDVPFRMAADGKQAILQFDGRPAQTLETVPSTDALRPVTADDLQPLGTTIEDDKATVAGKRAWLVGFRPSRDLLKRLLSVDLLGLRLDPDVRAIAAGRFRVRYAAATVLRADKLLRQIDVTLRVNDADMRILATYREADTGRLDDFRLDKPVRETVN